MILSKPEIAQAVQHYRHDAACCVVVLEPQEMFDDPLVVHVRLCVTDDILFGFPGSASEVTRYFRYRGMREFLPCPNRKGA